MPSISVVQKIVLILLEAVVVDQYTIVWCVHLFVGVEPANPQVKVLLAKKFTASLMYTMKADPQVAIGSFAPLAEVATDFPVLMWHKVPSGWVTSVEIWTPVKDAEGRKLVGDTNLGDFKVGGVVSDVAFLRHPSVPADVRVQPLSQ